MSDLYISIVVNADNGRRAQFERHVQRQSPPMPMGTDGKGKWVFSEQTWTNDDELGRCLMELYQEAQHWLGANKPVRTIKDRPQA